MDQLLEKSPAPFTSIPPRPIEVKNDLISVIGNLNRTVPKTEFKADEDIPLSLYESRFSKPYSMEYFGIKDDLLSKTDTVTTTRLKSIDDFILGQIKDNSLEDSKEVYDLLMQKVMEIVGVNKMTKLSTRLSKMHSAIALSKLFK